MSELKSIVNKIVSSGKGILAADESTGTMTKRLESVNVESTSDNRLNFRNTLFNRFVMVPVLSSAANMPLPDETILFTIDFNSDI